MCRQLLEAAVRARGGKPSADDTDWDLMVWLRLH